MTHSRRHFLSTGAAAALAPYAFASESEEVIRVGVIGCGGRGTGAIWNCLASSPMVRIVALGDVFAERVQSASAKLANEPRSSVTPETTFSGFDAFQKVLAADVDMVILATPPHFRPEHFAAAVAAGKHVFMEKPVAVDAPGVRTVIAAAAEAKNKNLSVVSGTQRRHQQPYLEAMQQVHDGRIGEIRSASCWWNQGFLWREDRTANMSDTEWQLRNWLYFTWLSGDHIVEQHIHNIDVCNWAIGGPPKSASGMGGREVRTGPEWGNIFDHFAIDFEYDNDVRVTSWCRQIDGCTGKVAEEIVGTKGILRTDGGRAIIRGESPWRTKGGRNPYEQEHVDLIASITGSGPYLNEAKRVAESTMTAIMGRDSAYSGKKLTWEQAINSDVRLGPEHYAFGPLPIRPVSVPGS